MNSTKTVVRALLLGFKDDSLAPQIEELGRTMKDSLGWTVTTYWIDGPDSDTARDRLENIVHTLKSTIRSADEKLVVYYGGHAARSQPDMAGRLIPVEEDTPVWASQTGTVIHAIDSRTCAECLLHFDLRYTFEGLLDLPNDMLLLFNTFIDVDRLQSWIQGKTSPAQDIHTLVVQRRPSDTTRNLRPSPRCSTKSLRCQQGSINFCDVATGLETAVLQSVLQCGCLSLKESASELVRRGERGVDCATLQGFKGNFEVSTVNAEPRATPEARPSKYREVHVLLVSWESDNVEDDRCVSSIRDVFESYYSFDVQSKLIPAQVSWSHDYWVMEKLREWVQLHDKDNALLIVYYCGHGGVQNGRLVGTHVADMTHFDISAVRSSLQYGTSADVLLILDCCHAGFVPALPGETGVLRRQTNHTMETLVACTAGLTTSGGAPHNFTRRLVGQLIFKCGEALSMDDYHSLLLQDGRAREVYIDGRWVSVNGSHKHRDVGAESIVLQPLRIGVAGAPALPFSEQAASSLGEALPVADGNAGTESPAPENGEPAASGSDWGETVDESDSASNESTENGEPAESVSDWETVEDSDSDSNESTTGDGFLS